jgi:lipoprotein-anchoring transpeptidase ErfK/SrfK
VSGSVITVLAENTKLTVTSQSNGWGKVTCGGQTGWVSMTYVMFTVNPGTGSGAIRIDIDLGSQYMVVYQGNNVLSRTYVSTGRRGFDTPTGTFYINRKVKVKDMSGVLGGEYYHVRDVPDVMYFTYRGHAIHGAYWHNNFGYVMSHGCVNLPLGFATWLYNITPIGTKVTIHY